jgi:hypothetical protein
MSKAKRDTRPRPAIVRYWEKVLKGEPGECWTWQGYIDSKGNGYGQFWDGAKLLKAHRYSYEIVNGPIPAGMVIDHVCHNDSGCEEVPCKHRACVNPDHLEAVTQSVNSIRGRSGNHQSAKTRCPSGHEYTPDNIYLRNAGKHRICKACHLIKTSNYYQSKRKAA